MGSAGRPERDVNRWAVSTFVERAALYIGIGFIIPFLLWFSGWGLVIGAIGGIIGSGILTGMPVALAIPFGLLVEWGTEIPLLIVYRLVAPRIGLSPVGRDIFKPKSFLFLGHAS